MRQLFSIAAALTFALAYASPSHAGFNIDFGGAGGNTGVSTIDFGAPHGGTLTVTAEATNNNPRIHQNASGLGVISQNDASNAVDVQAGEALNFVFSAPFSLIALELRSWNDGDSFTIDFYDAGLAPIVFTKAGHGSRFFEFDPSISGDFRITASAGDLRVQSITGTPEPASIAVWGSLIGLGLLFRRRLAA